MGRYRAPPSAGSKYITPEGAAALRAELDSLWRTKRPAVTAAVAEAAAQGDRSENAEYLYGKRQLAEIDRRIRFLRKRLDGMVVVDQLPGDLSRVFFGAWFELCRADGERKRYRLVGPDEAGSQAEYISMDSPLGKAVLGKRVDEELTVRAPEGTQRFRVAAVSYRERLP
jgi:transcription elongation factor GreB